MTTTTRTLTDLIRSDEELAEAELDALNAHTDAVWAARVDAELRGVTAARAGMR